MNLTGSLPPYLIATNHPKSRKAMTDLPNVSSIEALAEGAVEFGNLYTQNARTERARVGHFSYNLNGLLYNV